MPARPNVLALPSTVYQVHGPLEAPQRYLDRCGRVTEGMRHIFCGMVLALDDGIGNITAALRDSGLLDNTVSPPRHKCGDRNPDLSEIQLRF